MIEIIGIIATLFVLASMCFKTRSYRGSFWMRVLNIAGSVVFIVYGFLLPAIATAILNIALLFVNSYHLILLVKEHKKENSNSEKFEEKK